MPTQAEQFHSWLQDKLKDRHFQGFVFNDGSVISPAELAKLDPESLILVAQYPMSAQDES